MQRPMKVRHECCPNAATNLIGNRSARGYNWKLKAPGFVLPVIYCPWCAVCLDEWQAEQLRPRLVKA